MQYDIVLINEGHQQQGLNQRARMTPRMRTFTDYVRYSIQVRFDEEEEENEINEFADQDMAEYLEIRTYDAPPVIGIDVHEGDDPDEEQQVCAICLLEYQNGDTIGTLQCCHEFHVECINKWLKRKKACPFCRASVL